MTPVAATLRCRLVACVLLVLAGGAAASPRIQWTPCPAGADAGRSAAAMRCGEFEPGDTLESRPVRLRITRLQARPDRATPHPVIYVPGGPGDAGGQSVPALQAWRVFQQTAGWPRDLVIFDPRGTGMSTPRPRCPALEEGSDAAGALRRCFDRLGHATAAKLGARAQVGDLHRLIETLGQGSAVVWAESYGALVARRLAAEYPADVQLMILDSPVLRPRPARQRQALAYRRRRQQLLQYCRRRLACRLSVPSLAATIDGLIAARQRQPATVMIADPPRRAETVHVDAATVRALLLLSAYDERNDASVIHALERALYQPAALSALARPLVALNRQRGRRAPVYWSTRCQFTPVLRAARTADVADSCRQWPVPRLEPAASPFDVPTLVVAGTRDVLTSPASAARAVLQHPGWQFLPVEGGGHGVLAHDRCAQREVARFIARDGAWLGHSGCPGSVDGP